MRIRTVRMISLMLVGLMLWFPLPFNRAFAAVLTEDELSQIPGSEVLSAILDEPGAALNPEAGQFDYGTVAPVTIEPAATVDEHAISKALQFETKIQPPNSYDFQYVMPITASIAKDDALLATFYARTVKSTVETAEGQLSLVLEKTQTWEKSINENVTIPPEWKKFIVPIKASLDMPTDGSQLTLRLGFKPQTVEVADVKLVNYKKTVTFDQLPSTPVTYDGMEDDAPWRAEANARIEQIRKGGFEITVQDAEGRPVPGADVRVQMTKHAFKFGTAVNSTLLFGTDANAEKYRQKLKDNFNSAVMENELKWPWWEGDKARAVKLYNWLGANGFAVRGHNLIWDNTPRLPADVPGMLQSPDQLSKRIEDHIHETAGYFRGRLYDWDVLNEPVLNSLIRSQYGDQAAAEWFKMAKEADPSAKLYVNETQILGIDAPVIGNLSQILQSLKDNGAPLDGVGIQAHFGSTPVSPMAFYDQLTHFAQYANEIAITEFDMNSPREDVQAMFTRDILLAAFSHPNVESFTMWGFWDGAHWQNNAPLFRNDWSAKPALTEWRNLIYGAWWTDLTGVTDSEGNYKNRGFYGDYDITVSYEGVSRTVKTSFLKGKDNKVTVILGQDAADSTPAFVPLAIPDPNADITSPVWPYGSVFSASSVSPTSVTLNWPGARDNAAVQKYLIYRDGSLLTEAASNVTSYDVTGLTPGQRYTFTIEAADAQGNRSVPSLDIPVTTASGEDDTRPGWKKGSSLAVSDLSETVAVVSWPAASDNVGAAGYRVYVNGQIAGDTVQRSYTLSGLTENTLYTVRVEAKDSEGNLSAGGPIVIFRTFGTPDTTAPVWNDPVLASPQTGADRVTLSWSGAQDSRGVTAYRLFQGNQEVVTLPSSETSFEVGGLADHASYTFRVEAGDAAGNWSDTGPSLTVQTAVSQDVSAPQWPDSRNLTYSALTDRAVQLDWTPASDNIAVASYRLYMNDALAAEVDGNTLTHVVSNLDPSQTYTFRVEAGDAAGNWTTAGPSVTVTAKAGIVRTNETIHPSDDAFIQAPSVYGGAGTTNNVDYLRYKNAAGISGSDQNKNTGNNRRAYLKFPLDTVTGSVYSATLNLYVYAVQTSNMDIPLDLYAAGDDWSESSINWISKPADGANLGSSVVRNAGYWKTFDVTDYVRTEASGDKIVTFKLQDDSWLDQNVDMYAKENTAHASLIPYLSVAAEAVPEDTQPPVWGAGTLSVSGVTPHAATLAWSAASDDAGINGYRIYRDGAAIATVGADVLSYTATGLDPATVYAFKVEALDAVQQSSDGPSASVTTPAADSVPPEWPADSALTASGVSRFAAALQWTPAHDEYGIAEYVIDNGGDEVATVTGDVYSYRVTGLAAGSSNLFRITARDTSGNETLGPTVIVTTADPDSIAPAWEAGSMLTASETTASGIRLAWPASMDDTGVTQYGIYAGETMIAEVGKEIRQYYVNGLQDNTAYSFKVQAVDAAGNVSPALTLESVRTFQRDTIVPQWPTGSRITATPEGDQIRLQWDPAIDNVAIGHYQIYRDGTPVTLVDGQLTSVVLAGGPFPSAVYKVEAGDLVGNGSVFGPSTADPEIPVPEDATPPGWPVGSNLTADRITSTSIRLTWTPAVDQVGVSGYRLFVNGSAAAQTDGLTWKVTGLSAGTTYEFKVEAGDEAGNWSVNGPRLGAATLAASLPESEPTPAPAGSKKPDVEVRGGKAHVIIPTPEAAAVGGQAHVTLSSDTLAEAFSQAPKGTAGESRVVVEIPSVPGAAAYRIALPADYLTEKSGSNRIELSTEWGTLVLPGNMLANNAAELPDTVTVGIARKELPSGSSVEGKIVTALELTVSSGVSLLHYHNKDAPVELRIPYQASDEERRNAEHLIVWYVDDAGNAQWVPSGRYDASAGEIFIRTPHFSTYAVSYVRKTFGDLSSVPWARQAIEVLASRGILHGVSSASFQPAAAVTRADFTKMLVDTLGLTATVDDSFADVKKEDYYYPAVGIARKLGIVSGRDGNRFDPASPITRQEMFAILSRALASMNKPLPNASAEVLARFADRNRIAPYAQTALAALVQTGFVRGSAGKIEPERQTTRAEAAVVLYGITPYILD